MNLQKIIEINPKDIGNYCCIWDIKGKEEKLYKEMSEGKRKMFVYIENGAFLGGGSIVLDNGDNYRTIPLKRAYLSYLVVREEFQNKGIGTILIDYICEYAFQLGIEEITINVERSNPSAKKLYIRKGFNEIVLENANTLLLLKRLSNFSV